MKKKYIAPETKLIVFEKKDVLTGSYGWGDKLTDDGNADEL